MSDIFKDDYLAKYLAEDEAVEAACAEIKAVFAKHFPPDDPSLKAPLALAVCAELYPCDDKLEIRQLYVEWMLEHFAGRKVKANLPGFEKLYDAMVEAGLTEDEPYNHNDGDNNLFYIPHETAKIVCITTQSKRYLYMQEFRRFHVRRFYDEYDFEGKKDKHRLKYEAKFNRDGVQRAIAESDDLLWWSDCVPGCQYPQRPSLQWFKDHDFNMTYNDGRDIGYVATYCDLVEPRVDWAIPIIQK